MIRQLSSHRSWVFAAIALTVALLATAGRVEWVGANGTGPITEATISFEDDAGALTEAALESIGDTVVVTIVGVDLDAITADELQVHLVHDPAVTDIHSPECVDVFDGATSPGSILSINDGTGAVFFCELGVDLGDDSGGLIDFTLERVGDGPDTISFSTSFEDGSPTTFFDGGVAQPTVATATITVPDNPAPTPVPTETPVPTATPGGGGGGGGGGVQPTATPSVQLSRPSRPHNVQVSGGDRSVTITWEPPLSNGGAAINSYSVGIFGTTRFVVLPPSARSHTFENVVNGTDVQVRVRASNSQGDGLYSPLIKVTAGIVPTTPQNPNAVVVDGDTIIVSWDESDGNGVPVTKYAVTEVDGRLLEAEVDGTETSVTYQNVAVGEYSFAVKARNIIGDSELSEEVGAVVEEVQVEPTPTPEPAPNTPIPLPTATPAPPPGNRYELDADASEELETAFQAQFGRVVQLMDDSITLMVEDNEVNLLLPLEAGLPVNLAALDVNIETEQLSLAAQGTSSIVSFELADGLVISGTGTTGFEGSQIFLSIENPTLVYSPLPPASGSAAAAPGRAVRFELEIDGLQSAPLLDIEYFTSLAELGADTESAVQNEINRSSFGLGTLDDNVALIADVMSSGFEDSDITRMLVTFIVTDTWATNGIASDERPHVVKVSDSQGVFIELARCERLSDGQRECKVEFTGASAGFSSFSLLRLSVAGSTIATPTQVTATPADPGDPASGTPVPTATIEPTSVPQPVPTRPLELGSGNGDDGLSPAVIAAMIAVGLVVAGFTVVGLYRVTLGGGKP